MILNKTILIGRLANDPEVRYTTNEIPVARFSLGVNNEFNETDFFNIVAWRGLAKICREYLKKGKCIAIEGKLQIRKYEKDGEKRTLTEIVVNDIQILDQRLFNKINKGVK